MPSIQDFLCIFPFTKEEKENATLLLSSDESMAFVAVPNAIGGEGAVYVFTRIGPLWGHSQRLTAEDGESGGHFGKQLYLSEYGLLVVSSENKTVVSGTPYRFKNNGETWKLCTPISIGPQGEDELERPKLVAKWLRFHNIIEYNHIPEILYHSLKAKFVEMVGESLVKIHTHHYNYNPDQFDSKSLLSNLRQMRADGYLYRFEFKALTHIVASYIQTTMMETTVKNEKEQAQVKSSIAVTEVNMRLDPRSPDPMKDIEMATDLISKTRQPDHPISDMVYVFSESGDPMWVQRQSQHHVEQSTNAEPCMSKQSLIENQQQAFNDQPTTQGETMNDKQKQQADIHAQLRETILNKSVEEVRILFSTFCSGAVSKGMIDQNAAAHLHNLFGTYTKVPKGSTFQPMNPQFQPFAPMPPFMPMGFQQSHFQQPLYMGFQGLHPSQFQNPQAFRPNLPNQGARYEAERTLQQLDSQLAQTMMQLQQLEQAVENNKFQQTSLNAQCAAIRNLLNSTSGK